MYDMPFVNMVSVSNIGGIRLKNFFVAGAWISNEDEQSMTWVLSTLRAIVYDGSDNPTTIVVDSAKATRNAIASVYPKSNILLCTWHIQRNFHTECFKHFDNQKDLQSLQSAVNLIICSTDRQSYDHAINKYKVAATKSRNPSRVIQYLEM
jgi:transposase-like protein